MAKELVRNLVRAANSPAASAAGATTGGGSATATAPSSPAATIVLTGFRDKALEAALTARGHTLADSVTKKTTHVVYPDGPEPSSTKITKAREIGIAEILSLSAIRTALLS
jgi:NAD-dependent DNA ligase